MPTVRFNLREEVMKEALQLKGQMGLTWREVALQGLGMAVVPQPRIGRPPKPEIKEKAENHLKLEKQVADIFDKTFYSTVIWRGFLPLVKLSDAGWKWYKFYPKQTGVDENDLPTYSAKEIMLPVLSNTFPVYKNGRLNIQGIQKSAIQMATEEGKLVLTGEHPGWAALGTKGMLTTDGRNIITSTGNWPDDAVKDIIQARKQFKPKDPAVLIISSEGYGLLSQVMWEDPTHIRPPTTYKNFLLKQGIVSEIYEVDELYTQQGTQDSAIIYTPSKDNAWLVQGMKPSPHMWEGQDNDLICTVREVINIAIANPSAITEITGINCKTT